jgi:hypothetical protein
MQNKSSLIITGGWAHDFASSVPFLVENLREVNIDCEIAWDVDQSSLLMQQNKYDLIVGYACWFQMKDSRYSPEQRTQWSRTTSADWNDALLRQKTMVLVCLHCILRSFHLMMHQLGPIGLVVRGVGECLTTLNQETLRSRLLLSTP